MRVIIHRKDGKETPYKTIKACCDAIGFNAYTVRNYFSRTKETSYFRKGHEIKILN